MYNLIKSLIDRIVAGVLLLLLAPLGLSIVLGLTLLGRPVLFRQTRPGFRNKPFVIYKFTSLSQQGKPFLLGHVLRYSSLDELPQLWNILVGEMSFIGPRPLLMEYMDVYTSQQKTRHLVKPGITGWAQVHGRNLISLEQKVEYDLEYVKRISLMFDLLIVLKTVVQLFRWKEIAPQMEVHV